jgi:L-ascorbate metabolism protein UlaG (beta-lactamase superfamily)
MKITVIGHNTLLIETGGLRILTDPYFGPTGNANYQRLAPPVRSREELRDVDLVLASHNHWDHIDPQLFALLPPSTPVVAPWLTAWETRGLGAKTVHPLKTWKTTTFGSVQVSAVPAIHLVPTTGFVIESEGLCVYFAGDTFYGHFMRRIGDRFALDVALIPVTTYKPPMTMGEVEAVRATRDLHPRLVIPIHLGLTPRQAFLRTDHSPEGYVRRLRAAGLDTPVTVLHDGEAWQS